MTLVEKRQALLDELSPFDDPHERFQYIIDRAKTAPSLEEKYKIPAFIIEGCTSNLWMYPEFKNGTCIYHADADSVITKGIATLVCEFYSDSTPAEIDGTNADFLSQVGITQHLSPNRRNGLSNLVAKIRAFAVHCAKQPGKHADD